MQGFEQSLTCTVSLRGVRFTLQSLILGKTPTEITFRNSVIRVASTSLLFPLIPRDYTKARDKKLKLAHTYVVHTHLHDLRLFSRLTKTSDFCL